MHPPVDRLLLGVLGQAEADAGIEVDRALYIGSEDVEMVESLRVGAPVVVMFLQKPLALLHGGIEFERQAEGIGDGEPSALVGTLAKGVRQPLSAEEARRKVEICLDVRRMLDDDVGHEAQTSSSATLLRSMPSPSYSTSTTSPGLSHRGGSKRPPAPGAMGNSSVTSQRRASGAPSA
jgi:hypothetical protein